MAIDGDKDWVGEAFDCQCMACGNHRLRHLLLAGLNVLAAGKSPPGRRGPGGKP